MSKNHKIKSRAYRRQNSENVPSTFLTSVTINIVFLATFVHEFLFMLKMGKGLNFNNKIQLFGYEKRIMGQLIRPFISP